MGTTSIRILRNTRAPSTAFGKPIGIRIWLERVAAWLAHPRCRIAPDQNRQALARLDDDELSNLSERGRAVRREARSRAHGERPFNEKRNGPAQMTTISIMSLAHPASAARTKINRAWALALAALGIGLAWGTPAIGEQTCKPTLAFKDVQFSAMRPPTLERKWTAIVSVDASRCTTRTGHFAIGFSRLKEVGPEIEFREQF